MYEPSRVAVYGPLAVLLTSGPLACGGSGVPVTGLEAGLSVACVAPDAIPEDGWRCGQERTLTCHEVGEAVLYVEDEGGLTCQEPLDLSNAGPFAAGEHTVSVLDNAGEPVCSANLVVVDDDPPELETQTIQLWPPNHKFHTIGVEDCVRAVDGCEGELQGEFVWASSDEPIDSIGDGHHAPDILLSDDCRSVQVRAERQGPKDGRVYKLGVRFVDAAGNTAEEACQVIVDHDQRGATGVDSGEAYRVTFDGADGGPSCDGRPEEPPTADDPPASDDPPGDDDGDPPVPVEGEPNAPI